MIDLSEIVWAPECKFDEVGRVFFARGRCFRAIDDNSRERITEFMGSECFHYLVSNGLLVNTWISDEVILPDYSLVLEHEMLFCSRFSEWGFEMRRAVAIAAVNLIEISQKYGYCLLDPYPYNFTFSNGKIVYFDFGSFVKSNPELIRVMKYAFNRNLVKSYYLPLKLMANHCTFVNMPPRIGILPKLYDSPVFLPLLKNVIKSFDIYVHYNSHHFLTRFRFFYDTIPLVNKVAKRLFPKIIGTRDLLKGRIIYRQLRKSDLLKISNPLRNLTNLLPVEDSSIIHFAANLAVEIGLTFKTAVCVGNFNFDAIFELQEKIEAFVNLISHDSVYVDSFYKTLVACPGKINPICKNIVDNIQEEHIVNTSQYGGELVIVQDQLSILSRITQTPHSYSILPCRKYAIINALASYCKAYLLLPSEIDLEYKYLINERFVERHSGVYLGKNFTLYSKKQ